MPIHRLITFIFFGLLAIGLSGCVHAPKGITPVNNFELDRYLGKWYEIARLDHPFERGLEQISATYSVRDDGGVEVLNQGFNVKKQEWEQAVGKAYFVKETDVGYLKVSFFGPFYSAYVVFYLDDQYQTALISGPDHSYFWILSRTPTLPEQTLTDLVNRAEELRFNTSNLIYVNH